MNNHNEYNLFYCQMKEEVQDCIAAGIDINSLIHWGENALFKNCHTSAIQAMIEAGIDLDHTDHYGNNALFINSSPEILSLLIDSGINIHHTNDKGENCLSSHRYDRASTESSLMRVLIFTIKIIMVRPFFIITWIISVLIIW
ncbi:hypothetical protein ACSF6I_14585 [Escherichia coli]|uniref:hypothetical protein n=1 Tax=Escherichia coli TaxID=562 RepID=UPI003EEF52A2